MTTIDDTNPWQSALEQEQGVASGAGTSAAGVSASFRHDDDPQSLPFHTAHRSHNDNGEQDVDLSCSDRLSMSFIKTSLLCDALLGLFWLVDGCLLLQHKQQQEDGNGNDKDGGDDSNTNDPTVGTVSIMMVLFPAIVLCLRWPLALCHGYYTAACNRCGVYYSAMTSPLLAVYYGILCFWSLVIADKTTVLLVLDQILSVVSPNQHHDAQQYTAPYQQDNTTIYDTAITEWISHDHYYVVWSLLLFFSIWEITRYHALRFHYQRLVYADTTILLNDQRATHDRATTSRRPWWWQSHKGHGHHYDFANDELRQELLEQHTDNTTGLPDWVSEGRRDYHQQTGVSPSGRQEWLPRWLSPGRGHRGGVDETGNIRATDPRDETNSAGFANVQEEWASRTEEDPFWWSRDEDNDDDRNNSRNNGMQPSDPFDADDKGDSDTDANTSRSRARARRRG